MRELGSERGGESSQSFLCSQACGHLQDFRISTQVQLQTRLAKFLQYLLQMLEMVIKGQGEDQQVIEVDQEKVEQEA